jgi:hypothetical protein
MRTHYGIKLTGGNLLLVEIKIDAKCYEFLFNFKGE